MAHFAHIDKEGIVDKVIVAEQDFIDSGAVGDPAEWITTSYNKTIRKNFAGVGFAYDKVKDRFVPPRPYKGWFLNEETCEWEPSIPHPMNKQKYYQWDNDLMDWKEYPKPTLT